MWVWAFGQIPLLLQRKTGTRRRQNSLELHLLGFVRSFLKIVHWDLCPVLSLFSAHGKPAWKGWTRLSQKFGNGTMGIMLCRIMAAPRIHPWLCLCFFPWISPLLSVIPIPTSHRSVPWWLFLLKSPKIWDLKFPPFILFQGLEPWENIPGIFSHPGGALKVSQGTRTPWKTEFQQDPGIPTQAIPPHTRIFQDGIGWIISCHGNLLVFIQDVEAPQFLILPSCGTFPVGISTWE